jgi:hypothetical protein
VPKVNVYLPEDLATAVRAAGISVSPICQRALQDELHRREMERVLPTDLQHVLERLRRTLPPQPRADGALDAAALEEDQAGRQAGAVWVSAYANAHEIPELLGVTDPAGDYWGELDPPEEDPTLGPFASTLRRFFATYQGGAYQNRLPLKQDTPFTEGFLAGVREIWDKLQPHLPEVPD